MAQSPPTNTNDEESVEFDKIVKTAETMPSTGLLVLQWLTYAFWGWFALALLWLTAFTAAYYITGVEAFSWGTQIAYPLAGVIVLLVISLVTDKFYTRGLPGTNSSGLASVIMLIHAVIFALFGIAALITALFAVINMNINAGVSMAGEGSKVTLITALVMAVIYAALLARTLFARKLRRLLLVWGLMIFAALVVGAMGISGPVMQAAITKQDRLIEDALPTLVANINTYANTNDALPAKLSDTKTVSYASSDKEKVEALIDKNIVRYTPNTKEPTSINNPSIPVASDNGSTRSAPDYMMQGYNSKRVFYYKICVTYQAERRSPYGERVPAIYQDKSYGSTAVDTYMHGKGEECYDLQTQIMMGAEIKK